MKAKMLLFFFIMALPALACGEATPDEAGGLPVPTKVATTVSRATASAVERTSQPLPSTEVPKTAATGSPIPLPTQTWTVAAPTTYCEVVPSGLNLRAGPGTEYEIWQELHQGDRLGIVAKAPDGIWLNVIAPDGQDGWVSSKYVDVVEGGLDALPVQVPPQTSTPAPTSAPSYTPIPLSQPTISVSDDTLAYAIQAIGLAQTYASSFQDLSVLATEASENPILFLDVDWKLEVAVVLATMQLAGEQVRDLQPPPALEAAHQQFVEATRHIDLSAELLAEGIDDLDPDKIQQANTQMMLGHDAVLRATEEFRKVAE